MARKHYPAGGTRHVTPFQTRQKAVGGNGMEVVSDVLYQHVNQCCFFQDFLGGWTDAQDVGAIYDASASGSPTTAVVTAGSNGQLQLKAASTSEAEDIAYYWGDKLQIPGNARNIYFEARIQIPTAITTNEDVVIGLSSAIDTTTLDNITRNLWFRLPATMALKVERDDATTDTDDQAGNVSVTLTAGTWYRFIIEKKEDGTCYFRLQDDNGENDRLYYSLSSAFGANNLQPVTLVKKASGTTTPELLVDYVLCMWDRT